MGRGEGGGRGVGRGPMGPICMSTDSVCDQKRGLGASAWAGKKQQTERAHPYNLIFQVTRHCMLC